MSIPEAQLLIVDDDDRLRKLLKKFFSSKGYNVSTANGVTQAKNLLDCIDFDLIVLDVMMPDGNGMNLARQLRGSLDTPILMLTAMGDPPSRVEGLEAGVADYMPKPFEPRELELRIENLLKNNQRAESRRVFTLGQRRLDPERNLLGSGDESVRLTSLESEILATLAEKNGQPLERAVLARRCRIEGGDRAVDVHVNRLRRKIEPNPRAPRYLITERNKGYRLLVDADRVDADRVDADRVDADRVDADRVDADRVDADRVDAGRVDADRVDADRVDADRVDADKLSSSPP